MSIDWAIWGPLAGSAVKCGMSFATAHGADSDYRVKVVIEIENWTKWVLKETSYSAHGGVISVPPSNVLPLKREAMTSRKTAHTATGAYGTASWKVGDLDKRIVVLWDAPYNFNFETNELALAIVTSNKEHQNRWYKLMKNETPGPDFSGYKKGLFGKYGNELLVQDNDLEVTGIMGSSHHPTIKIIVKPTSLENMPDEIKTNVYH